MKLPEVLESKELTCAIPYAAVGQLLEAISETVKDDRERGITLCADGHELAFPQVTGTHGYVMGEGCPVGKKKVGTFHTHPRGLTEKSVDDWFYEMDLKDSVSCMGVETESEPGIIEREITCHTFQKNHPEYKKFRDQFIEVGLDAMRTGLKQ